jgi:hypothetical protein
MAEDATLGSRCSMAEDATLGAIRTVQIELPRLSLTRVVHRSHRLANCSSISSILHSERFALLLRPRLENAHHVTPPLQLLSLPCLAKRQIAALLPPAMRKDPLRIHFSDPINTMMSTILTNRTLACLTVRATRTASRNCTNI